MRQRRRCLFVFVMLVERSYVDGLIWNNALSLLKMIVLDLSRMPLSTSPELDELVDTIFMSTFSLKEIAN